MESFITHLPKGSDIFTIEINICEYTGNDNADIVYIKKMYQTCFGKLQLLECLSNQFNNTKKFIENKIAC